MSLCTFLYILHWKKKQQLSGFYFILFVFYSWGASWWFKNRIYSKHVKLMIKLKYLQSLLPLCNMTRKTSRVETIMEDKKTKNKKNERRIYFVKIEGHFRLFFFSSHADETQDSPTSIFRIKKKNSYENLLQFNRKWNFHLFFWEITVNRTQLHFLISDKKKSHTIYILESATKAWQSPNSRIWVTWPLSWRVKGNVWICSAWLIPRPHSPRVTLYIHYFNRSECLDIIRVWSHKPKLIWRQWCIWTPINLALWLKIAWELCCYFRWTHSKNNLFLLSLLFLFMIN